MMQRWCWEGPSGTLDSLERQLALMDFAVLILAAEDITISRGDEMLTHRDNVLFEPLVMPPLTR